MKRRHRAPGSFVTIAHITKIGLWDGSIVADVVLTPTAGPDDGNPHTLRSTHAAPRFIQPA